MQLITSTPFFFNKQQPKEPFVSNLTVSAVKTSKLWVTLSVK